ncbi:hypothetical protein E8E14_010100 [Neopestalotiopsis sp. 37M]|nr:hypothetical protein E8E14_010100 [Neopestalotiopsis sp. 37M]
MERVTAGTDEIPFSYASPDLSGPGSDQNRLATWPEPRRGKLQKNAIASFRLSRPLAQEQPVGRHSGALHETVDLGEFFTNRTILESTYEIDVPASGSEEWPLQNKNNDKAGQEPSSRAIALSNKHSRLESHSVHNYDPTSPSRSTSLRDFFLQCAPTDERLEELGKRWLDRVLLRRRLFHCRPFNIMVQDNLKGYAEKSNHELSDHLSDDNHWDKFAEQMSSAWPTSFGKLVPQDDGEARQFLFGAPYLDDDTIFACRKVCLSKDGDQSAVEYLLSVAIVMRKKVQNEMPSILKYSVVNWVDYRTDLNARSERTSRAPVLSNAVDRDLDLKDCGTGASGFVQFLIVLARAIDHWAKCWDAMLDKIDETVGVQLQDTLDKKRWEMLMFDNSFQLSEQYFTVLQLLRIYQDWIVEAEEGIDSLGEELINQCRSWHAWQHQLSPVDEVEWPLLMENLKSNFSNVNGFFRQRVNSLKERIQRKKDEVESLRDGLFNAASLRENLKANTMNLYIGVFTIVTVFFTPLSFIATFWAIPYTSTDARSSTPKEFLTSFITVPLLTYIASGGIIAYVWTRASPSLETSIQVKLRRVSGIIWESLGKSFSTALGKFRKRSKNIPLDKEANSAKADSLDQWSSQS